MSCNLPIPVSPLTETRSSLTAVLAAASVAGILVALSRYSTALPFYWSFSAVLDLAAWISGWLALAFALRRCAPLIARPLIVASLAGYLALGVGLDAALAAAAMFTSALLYGRGLLMLIFREDGGGPDWSSSTFVGLALLLAVLGLAIHAPINYRLVYCAALALPALVLLRRGHAATLRQELGSRLTAGASVLDGMPYWWLVVLLVLLAVNARYAFFPTVGYDDNAHHLRLWTELTLHQRYSFDVVTQVWEVAPLSVAGLHTIASLCAGTDARAALNLGLLLLLHTQVWSILTYFRLRPLDRMLLLLALASTPMLASLLGTLQAELFLATLMAGGTRLALQMRRAWASPDALALLAIAALCVATKLPGAFAGLLLICAAIVQAVRTPASVAPAATLRRPSLLVLAIGMLAIAALGTYVNAWLVTGNPVFPLYNGIFKSPYFEAVNFSDKRWISGFSLQSYWNVFFKTSSFNESKDFVAGFQFLFLPVIALLALTRESARRMLIVLIPLVGFGIVMFYMTQYWRYMFPVAPLATVLIGALLSQDLPRQTPIIRAVILACVALNLYFLPGISWVFDRASPQQAYTAAGRDLIASRYNAPKQLTTYLNERYPGATVLYPASAPFGATLLGKPVYTNWYAPAHEADFAAARNPDAILAFLKQERIDFVVWSTFDTYPAGSAGWALREYLSRTAYPELRLDNYTLYRLTGKDLAYRRIFDLQKQTDRASTIVDSEQPKLLATIQVDRATALRYWVSLRCDSPKGRMILALRWNTRGDAYYRLVPCDTAEFDFHEAMPVPVGVTHVELQLARQDTAQVVVTNMKIDSN